MQRGRSLAFSTKPRLLEFSWRPRTVHPRERLLDRIRDARPRCRLHRGDHDYLRQPFQVGDRVQFSGEYEDILKIGLRSVRMNTLDHNVVTIPNNKVLTDSTILN